MNLKLFFLCLLPTCVALGAAELPLQQGKMDIYAVPQMPLSNTPQSTTHPCLIFKTEELNNKGTQTSLDALKSATFCRLAKYISARDLMNVNQTCKKINTNTQNAKLSSFVKHLIENEYNPVGLVLRAHENGPTVHLYGQDWPVEELLRELTRKGQQLTQVQNYQDISMFDCDFCPSTASDLPEFTTAPGFVPTEDQRYEMKKWVFLALCKNDLDSIETQLNNLLLKNHNDCWLALCFNESTITHELTSKLKNYPIRSIRFDRCEFPEGLNILADLQFLKELCINCCAITEWPLSLCELSQLEHLALCGTEIEHLPEEIGNLINLRFLNLYENKRLTEIPPTIGKLKHLRTLYLSDFTHISTLPKELSDLRQLRKIIVNTEHWDSSYNGRLATLPQNLGNLSRLRELHAAFNDITELPESMALCKNLESVCVRGNSLQEIPDFITQWTHLNEFIADDNPDDCLISYELLEFLSKIDQCSLIYTGEDSDDTEDITEVLRTRQDFLQHHVSFDKIDSLIAEINTHTPFGIFLEKIVNRTPQGVMPIAEKIIKLWKKLSQLTLLLKQDSITLKQLKHLIRNSKTLELMTWLYNPTSQLKFVDKTSCALAIMGLLSHDVNPEIFNSFILNKAIKHCISINNANDLFIMLEVYRRAFGFSKINNIVSNMINYQGPHKPQSILYELINKAFADISYIKIINILKMFDIDLQITPAISQLMQDNYKSSNYAALTDALTPGKTLVYTPPYTKP